MTLDEIKIKPQVNNFIREKKARWKLNEKNIIKSKTDGNNILSICDEVF